MHPLAKWTALLASDDLDIRVRAARQLVSRPDVPLPTLVVILEDLVGSGLGASTRKVLLARTDPELFDEMISLLGSATPVARQTACDVLGHLGDERATPQLLDRLADPDWWVRHASIGALGALGDRRAVAPLRREYLAGGADVNIELALHHALGRLRALDGLPSPSWSSDQQPD